LNALHYINILESAAFSRKEIVIFSVNDVTGLFRSILEYIKPIIYSAILIAAYLFALLMWLNKIHVYTGVFLMFPGDR
jgi:hypothetical protein